MTATNMTGIITYTEEKSVDGLQIEYSQRPFPGTLVLVGDRERFRGAQPAGIPPIKESLGVVLPSEPNDLPQNTIKVCTFYNTYGEDFKLSIEDHDVNKISVLPNETSYEIAGKLLDIKELNDFVEKAKQCDPQEFPANETARCKIKEILQKNRNVTCDLAGTAVGYYGHGNLRYKYALEFDRNVTTQTVYDTYLDHNQDVSSPIVRGKKKSMYIQISDDRLRGLRKMGEDGSRWETMFRTEDRSTYCVLVRWEKMKPSEQKVGQLFEKHGINRWDTLRFKGEFEQSCFVCKGCSKPAFGLGAHKAYCCDGCYNNNNNNKLTGLTFFVREIFGTIIS